MAHALHDTLILTRADTQHQVHDYLADVERQLQVALAQTEASLRGYQRALAALAEARQKIDHNSSDAERSGSLGALTSVTGLISDGTNRSFDRWREPAFVVLKDQRSDVPADRLSPREVEVLVLVANGRSNKAIAQELFLSIRTVERHINNIYRKLDVQNRSEATAYAMRQQLI